jgi:hypothetical protein
MISIASPVNWPRSKSCGLRSFRYFFPLSTDYDLVARGVLLEAFGNEFAMIAKQPRPQPIEGGPAPGKWRGLFSRLDRKSARLAIKLSSAKTRQ